MIRELSKRYLAELVKLNLLSLKPLEKKIGKTDPLWIKEYFEYTFKEGKVFGYFLDSKLVGCVGYIINPYGGSAEIQHVLVDPDFHRKGLGNELMGFLENYIKENHPEIKEFRLSVRYGNKGALGFYGKNGYSKRSYIMKKKI